MAFVKTAADGLPTARLADRVGVVAAVCTLVVLVIPWINPFAVGPTPNVIPWLVSLGCFASLLLIVTTRQVPLTSLVGAAWLLAALFNSGAGLLQFLGHGPSLAPWINTTAIGEAFGNLRQRNQFATLVNMGVAVLLWQAPASTLQAIARRGSDGDDARLVLWSVVAMALLALGNAVSASRTGLLQLAMLMLLVLVSGGWRNRRIRILSIVAVFSYVAASALLPLLLGMQAFGGGAVSRFQADGLPCGSRIALWSNVLHLIGLKPWFGWGWGELDYAHFITAYPGVRFCNILDNAHNLPLHLAVELGIPAALLLCGLLAWLVVRARPWRESRGERQTAWVVLALIGLHSLLEYPLWYGPFQIAVVLAVWILWCTPKQASGPTQEGCTASGQIASATRRIGIQQVRSVAAVLIAALAYAAWDYHRISQVYKAPSLRSSAYRDDPLGKVQDSWLFRNQVRFAVLTLSTVTPDNAQTLNALARQLLHFSPEARVVEKLIDSDLVLGRMGDAAYYMLRFRRAFPAEYARWKSSSTHASLPELPPLDP
jgi:O-antigen ligase